MSHPERRQGVVILGSTGSIGTSTLDVIDSLPERFYVAGLAAASNRNALQAQVDRYHPAVAHIESDDVISGTEQLRGADALIELASHPDADLVVVATTGHTAIEPTIAALRLGKTVALANKETIVAAGEIVMREVKNGPGTIRPVDSEHSAIWQCLGHDRFDPASERRLILTASGGPFRGRTANELSRVTPEDALKHPNWTMGAKVTIDSATLMNKGLEVIEAHWLFDCPLDAIDVIVHPQSIVHSIVELRDGALIAQMASHDMRLPIQYALTYPDRVECSSAALDLAALGQLTFEEPDLTAFPLLRVAREAAEMGSTYPTVLSAADSLAVDAFLARTISFPDIAWVVESALDRHMPVGGELTLEAIHAADRWARKTTAAIIASRSR